MSMKTTTLIEAPISQKLSLDKTIGQKKEILAIVE